ncbi:hypothetical protein GQ42DRAFT_181707, partial [Ramicandelaber brevisporus]
MRVSSSHSSLATTQQQQQQQQRRQSGIVSEQSPAAHTVTISVASASVDEASAFSLGSSVEEHHDMADDTSADSDEDVGEWDCDSEDENEFDVDPSNGDNHDADQSVPATTATQIADYSPSARSFPLGVYGPPAVDAPAHRFAGVKSPVTFDHHEQRFKLFRHMKAKHDDMVAASDSGHSNGFSIYCMLLRQFSEGSITRDVALMIWKGVVEEFDIDNAWLSFSPVLSILGSERPVGIAQCAECRAVFFESDLRQKNASWTAKHLGGMLSAKATVDVLVSNEQLVADLRRSPRPSPRSCESGCCYSEYDVDSESEMFLFDHGQHDELHVRATLFNDGSGVDNRNSVHSDVLKFRTARPGWINSRELLVRFFISPFGLKKSGDDTHERVIGRLLRELEAG